MKLYIFDIDGTLIDRDTEILLPNVYDWFKNNEKKHIAFATNQGGVGLRYWLESSNFDGSHLPNQERIGVKFRRLVQKLTHDPERQSVLFNNINVCYAYQNEKGQWSPTPPFGYDYSWQPIYRKPSPGMLNRAMAKFLCKTTETIMIGDRSEDEEAAKRAGCYFVHADEFFKRNLTTRKA